MDASPIAASTLVYKATTQSDRFWSTNKAKSVCDWLLSPLSSNPARANPYFNHAYHHIDCLLATLTIVSLTCRSQEGILTPLSIGGPFWLPHSLLSAHFGSCYGVALLLMSHGGCIPSCCSNFANSRVNNPYESRASGPEEIQIGSDKDHW